MIDFIIAAVVIAIVGAAVVYIYKEKKSGKKCIGCPYADSCSAKSRTCGSKEEK